MVTVLWQTCLTLPRYGWLYVSDLIHVRMEAFFHFAVSFAYNVSDGYDVPLKANAHVTC